jgi:Uma2 family endonuclease
VHIWTRAEYERIVDAGGFDPEARLELIDGEIVDMSPQNSRHASAADKVEEALRACFRTGFYVRAQKPLALGAYSEPEPDVAVVPGRPGDYVRSHPGTAVLIVEVSDSSLAIDRGRKCALYARNGIPEYWVLNLPDHRLEVHRQPDGEAYATRLVLDAEQRVCPLAAPGCEIRVADLLP